MGFPRFNQFHVYVIHSEVSEIFFKFKVVASTSNNRRVAASAVLGDETMTCRLFYDVIMD